MTPEEAEEERDVFECFATWAARRYVDKRAGQPGCGGVIDFSRFLPTGPVDLSGVGVFVFAGPVGFAADVDRAVVAAARQAGWDIA